MSQQDRRAEIIARVQKLRAMTTERGASEHEALAAIAAAERLIAEFNLSQSELEIRADAKHCITDGISSLRSKQTDWVKLAIAIEQLYGTICWIEKTEEDALDLGFAIELLTLKYYGFPQDVAGSIATMVLCSLAIDNEIANLGRKAKAKRESFEMGMCVRLRERLNEMRKRRQGPAMAPGALVVLKEKLVADEFSKLGIKTYRRQVADTAPDAKFFAQGRAAAERVGITERVGGQAQRQLGGKP